MRTVIESSRLACMITELRPFARIARRGSAVTLVLLLISALPGPVPATSHDAARAHAEAPERVHYVRFQTSEGVAWGMLEGDRLLEVHGRPGRDAVLTGRTFPLRSVKLLPPNGETRTVISHGAAR